MIRTVSGCPFCGDGVVAFDDRLEIIFNPDSGKDTPCDHLSFFWVSLPGASDWYWGRLWERGRGLRHLDTDDLLIGLVFDLTLDSLVPEDRPDVSHLVVGATAGMREDKSAGTGEIWVYPPEGSPELVLFDAYAVYAYDAAVFVAAMHEKARIIKIEASRGK
jgi:hypothetical protein